MNIHRFQPLAGSPNFKEDTPLLYTSYKGAMICGKSLCPKQTGVHLSTPIYHIYTIKLFRQDAFYGSMI
jgi:hypothetical protein